MNVERWTRNGERGTVNGVRGTGTINVSGRLRTLADACGRIRMQAGVSRTHPDDSGMPPDVTRMECERRADAKETRSCQERYFYCKWLTEFFSVGENWERSYYFLTFGWPIFSTDFLDQNFACKFFPIFCWAIDWPCQSLLFDPSIVGPASFVFSILTGPKMFTQLCFLSHLLPYTVIISRLTRIKKLFY